jgi:hypothetical protein
MQPTTPPDPVRMARVLRSNDKSIMGLAEYMIVAQGDE